MHHELWPTFITFLAALAVLCFGIACLVLAEKTDAFGWNATRVVWKPTRKARQLRIVGWVVVGLGIPLLMTFLQELLTTFRVAD
jgi:hypothetical protein